MHSAWLLLTSPKSWQIFALYACHYRRRYLVLQKTISLIRFVRATVKGTRFMTNLGKEIGTLKEVFFESFSHWKKVVCAQPPILQAVY